MRNKFGNIGLARLGLWTSLRILNLSQPEAREEFEGEKAIRFPVCFYKLIPAAVWSMNLEEVSQADTAAVQVRSDSGVPLGAGNGEKEKQRFFKKDFIYVLLDRGEGREKERERNISVWLTLTCSLLDTWPATQASALTGN